MKSFTINGHKYRLTWDADCRRVRLHGRGMLVPPALPAGVTLDDPRLRDEAARALAAARERRRAASEVVQARVRAGAAGLGVVP